jgi:phosphoribosylanthranilate isomerase
LTASTVADAVRISGARAVDVSSGVERARGKKDENKIHAFIQAAQIG